MSKRDGVESETPIKLGSDFLIYKSGDGDIKVDVLLQDENIWLRQDNMATLFGVERSVITKHLKNIFDEGELNKESNVQNLHIANSDKPVKFYNLDVIISAGYRVNSHRATMFRIWANKILKEYIVKGAVLDDERLKVPNRVFGQDYFDEVLARIKDIRSSERRVYQKITDIYIQCSADYSVGSETTQTFFATVQNKLHHAIAHQTAAEIIYSRADGDKEHMGLTTWKNAPAGLIRKPDVSIAKNYLTEAELVSLNRIVGMYLDYAEEQTSMHRIMYMDDWVKKLDAFLKFNEKDILVNAGKISAEVAKVFAEEEFEKFNVKQLAVYESDFDKSVNRVSILNEIESKIKKKK